MQAISREDVIKMLRAKQGKLTQREFAATFKKCSEQYLSDVYSGRRDPGVKVLEFLGLEKAFAKKRASR
jgi:hypothetical protein